MIVARQSTAFETAVGPVLDADGVAVTDCVVGDFKLKKTTGNFAALNGSATLTHVSAGVYDLVLTTSDTDTVGVCVVAIDDTVNACQSLYLQVIEEAIYDAFFAASANGFAGAAGASTVTFSNTSIATVTTATNVTTVNGLAANVITAASIATGAIDADAIADGAIDAGALAADCITAAKIANGAIDAATFAADVDAEILSYLVDDATRIDASALNTATGTTIPAINAAVNGLQATLQGVVFYSGTIGSTGNDTTHVNIDLPAGVGDDQINGLVLVLYDTSAGTYHARYITDWVASTELATLDSALPVTPQDATDLYWILSADLGRLYTRLGAPAGASVAADIAAVKSDTAAILVDTAEIGAAGAGLTEAGGTGDHLTAVPWNAAWDAEVQSEVTDGLNAYDPPTRAELTSDTNSILARLRWVVLVDGTIGATGNTTTTVHLPGLTYGNDEINGYLLVILDVSTGEYHWRKVTDWVLATELATVDALPFTPQDSTDTYAILAALADAAVTGGDATAANQATIIALLGTPAGASVSADILTIDNLVDDLESRLGTPSNLGSGATVAANLVDIESQTDDIGAAGAGLTALATAAELAKVPKSDSNVTWNATALASIQSEANDALVAYDAATGTDVTTAAGAVTVTTGGITRASFAADTGLQTVRSNTAQAGASGTITLDASASGTNDFYNGCWIYLTGGTGAGQVRYVLDYVGSTKVATIDGNNDWDTTPDNTTTFAILPAGGVATTVWGASLTVTTTFLNSTLLPAVWAGISSVRGDTTAAANMEAFFDGTGYAGTNNVIPTVTTVTDRVTANTDQLAGQTVTAAAGVTFPSSVASPTNITAGTITTVTNLTNAPTSGDLTATMKASVNTEVDTALADVGLTTTVTGRIDAAVSTRASQTSVDDLPTNAELSTALAAADDAVLAAIGALSIPTTGQIATAVFTTAMTEAYRSAGATATLAQFAYEVIAHLGESSIAGTTKTLKKLDGSTTAKTYTLDSSSTPTAITETT